jgi:hypothetical protein
MASFNLESQKYLGVDAFKECLALIELDGTDFENDWDPIDPPDMPNRDQPETFSIALPSALPHQSSNRPLLTQLMKKEMELRKGHANDCLATMRSIIGQEAFQYKKILRPAHDKVHRTRARSSIQTVHRTLILQSRLYKRTRKAMLSLNMELDVLDSHYKELTKNDIQVSSAVADPNIPGSSRTQLSWIWTTHQGVQANDNHLTECELYLIFLDLAHQEQSIGSIGCEQGPDYTDGKKKLLLHEMKCIGRPTILGLGRDNGLCGNLHTLT